MCTFCSSIELPTRSKTDGSAKKSTSRLISFLKPNKPKEFYRFRLLWFKTPRSNRDFPFIERYIHQHWTNSDKGFRTTDDVITCPTTKWVDFDGDPYKECPLCRAANKHFIAMKNSNYSDAISKQKYRDMKRAYQAVIPVYIVNDPNYEQANGKIRCFTFDDKDQYKAFLEVVKNGISEAKKNGYSIWNGTNAVDFYAQVDNVTETVNEGTPKERTFSRRKIVKMGFFQKPYDIPAITKQAVDDFPFDDTFYVSASRAELEEFNKKYFAHPDADIPEEDFDIDSVSETKVKATNKVQESPTENKAKEEAAAELPESEDLDDLLSDSEDLPAETPKAEAPAEKEEKQPKKEDEPVAEPALDESSLDDLLADLS